MHTHTDCRCYSGEPLCCWGRFVRHWGGVTQVPSRFSFSLMLASSIRSGSPSPDIMIHFEKQRNATCCPSCSHNLELRIPPRLPWPTPVPAVCLSAVADSVCCSHSNGLWRVLGAQPEHSEDNLGGLLCVPSVHHAHTIRSSGQSRSHSLEYHQRSRISIAAVTEWRRAT